MILKKMMIAICLTAVYTTHCAHAAVDFKNKAADDPAPVTCSTQNYLLPTGYHYDQKPSTLVIMIKVDKHKTTRCNYAYTALCTANSKTCILRLQSHSYTTCPSTLSGTQDTKNKSVFTFTVNDNMFNERITQILWVANQETPDYTLLATRNDYSSTANYQVTLNTNTFNVGVTDISGNNNISCQDSLASSAITPAIGDILSYTIALNVEPHTSITCMGTYTTMTSPSDSNMSAGIAWSDSNDPACYATRLPMMSPPNPKLKELQYQMIDLSPIFENLISTNYSLLNVQFESLLVDAGSFASLGPNVLGPNSGNVYLYTNSKTTALIPRLNPSDNISASFWTNTPYPAWAGLANVLKEGSLPKVISTEYVIQDPKSSDMINCLYNKNDSAYDLDKTYSNSGCKQLSGTGNTFIAQPVVEAHSNQFTLSRIFPTESNAHVTLMIDRYNSAIIQFNPPEQPNGVKILNASIQDAKCENKNQEALKGTGAWLQCVTTAGDRWVGLENMLMEDELPDKFTAQYVLPGSSGDDPETCTYTKTDKGYTPAKSSCPQVKLQDNIIQVPAQMATSSGGKLLLSMIQLKKQAGVSFLIPQNQATPLAPASMQFNPPDYPRGMKVTRQGITMAHCLDNNNQTINGLNQWLECKQ